MSQSFLSLEGVSKHFGPVAAVDEVTFSVDRGQVVGFLGPNGAGKSTTMRMITQFIEPDQGQIYFDGQRLSESDREAKRRIGYLPENNPLYNEMLVTDYLDFVAGLRGIPSIERRSELDRVVVATAIEDVFYRPIGELSKGFKQRVGLAQAILHRPELLVLDEPTEGLDPNQRVEIRHLISHLGKERTVILSTHVLQEVQHTCSRLLIINRGKIVADGPVEQLVASAKGVVQIAVEIQGSGVAKALEQLNGVTRVETRDTQDGRTTFTVMADGNLDVRPAIFGLAREKNWTLYELHQETGSLEDLFRQLTAEPKES